MIRVVHVLTRTNIGGPSVMLADLLDGLPPTEFEQIVVRGAPSEREGDYFEGRSVTARVITIGGLRRSIALFAELRSLVALVRTLRHLRPDVVHTHMAKAGVIGRIAAFIARVPVRVHTFHGHLLHGYFSRLITRMFVTVERLLRRITTHSLVVGERTRLDLLSAKVIDQPSSSAIMPAVRHLVHHERSAARTALGVAQSDVVVGFIGRLTGVKRPDRFLRIADAIPHATFVIVGDGPLREETERQAAMRHNVAMRDWHRDVSLVLSAVDVVVLTSDNEGVPLSIIEAATAGRPVVSTNVGSVSEIVAHSVSGFVASTDDELIRYVKQLVEDPALRSEMGATAARYITTRCSMATYLNDHADLYRRLTSH